MKYRYAELLAAKSVTTETLTIDINLQDPISRIEIGYALTLADSAMQAQLGANITKIELVDGSDIFHSMNGLENQALCIYDRRVHTMNDSNLTAGAKTYSTFGIDFGRFLYDPELAFDPKQFRNPQLKITFDVDACDASASVATVEIFAHCFDEKIVSPIGFLMSKKHYAYTPAANNAYEYIDLPTDYTIRQLLIRGFNAGKHPDGVVGGARLSEDNDKRVVFDLNLSTYMNRMKGVWLPVIDGIFSYLDAAGTYDKYVTPTSYDTILSGSSISVIPSGLDGYIIGGYLQWLSESASPMQTALVRGWAPNHCLQIPFGKQDDLNDWYDVMGKGSVLLRTQAGGDYSGAEISVILQQLRRY